MTELLWLLLPVAAASGWVAARRSLRRAATTPPQAGAGLQPDYFRGINYLLNEQPDKAIEAFIRVLEVDSETVETHLALGNLYRRRGEVDRAIRIHQNLIARPTLREAQRQEALLELGYDYMSAGLLDRAENLFQELSETDGYTIEALRQVIDVYEQEKDWDNAIASARRLERATGDDLGGVIAHYYCERAELAQQRHNLREALEQAELALESHPACVRASLLMGDILVARQAFDHAIEAYRRVESQDADFLPEAVARLERCYAAAGRRAELTPYLHDLLGRYGGVSVTLTLAELKREREGAAAAAAFIGEQLRKRPSVRGLDRLLELELELAGEPPPERLTIVKTLTGRLLEDRPEYKCRHCGFPAKSLYWQCPACKHWNTIKPIQGLEGE